MFSSGIQQFQFAVFGKNETSLSSFTCSYSTMRCLSSCQLTKLVHQIRQTLLVELGNCAEMDNHVLRENKKKVIFNVPRDRFLMSSSSSKYLNFSFSAQRMENVKKHFYRSEISK